MSPQISEAEEETFQCGSEAEFLMRAVCLHQPLLTAPFPQNCHWKHLPQTFNRTWIISSEHFIGELTEELL